MLSFLKFPLNIGSWFKVWWCFKFLFWNLKLVINPQACDIGLMLMNVVSFKLLKQVSRQLGIWPDMQWFSFVNNRAKFFSHVKGLGILLIWELPIEALEQAC